MKFDDHFLSWILIWSILIYLSNLLLDLLKINNYFLSFLFAGFILTLGSYIFYSLLYKNKFKINWWFTLWISTHAVSYWLISLLLSLFKISSQLLYYLLFGLVMHLLTWFVKHKIYYKFKVKHKNLKIILITIVLIIVLLFVSSLSLNSTTKIGVSSSNSSNSILDKIKTFFTSINPDACPQLAVPMMPSSEMGNYITNGDINTLQNGWRISVYNLAEVFGVKTDFVFCHKGRSEGEDPSYFYCDSGGLGGGLPYLSKTSINSDGTIGKTTKKVFVNIYDNNENFIKTICGKDPESVTEENFKSYMRELDNLFSLN